MDYEGVPIFFICKSVRGYYGVVCTNIEDLKYIVVRTSLIDLSRMLHGEITMYDFFAAHSTYWEIETSTDVNLDVVKIKPMNEEVIKNFPERGAYYEILTDTEREYMERIDKEVHEDYSKVYSIKFQSEILLLPEITPLRYSLSMTEILTSTEMSVSEDEISVKISGETNSLINYAA